MALFNSLRATGSQRISIPWTIEIKWGDKQPTAPKSWRTAYPDAEYAVTNRETFMDFVDG
jgi:hypothetical protein